MDGYSRMITYLKCSTNNRADTVFKLFEEAIRKHGLPSRIRADFGTENVEIARFMLSCPERGLNRGSMICGLSVHNQRIERLWGEVKRNVVRHFQNIFYFLERQGFLDPLNEVHLFSLHYVYTDRINQALNELVRDWAFHPMSSAHNKSPRQLWHEGMTRVIENDPLSLEAAQVQSWHDYGIDETAPLPEINSDNDVEIPETLSLLCHHHSVILGTLVNSLHDDANEGIDNYLQTVEYAQGHANDSCCIGIGEGN